MDARGVANEDQIALGALPIYTFRSNERSGGVGIWKC